MINWTFKICYIKWKSMHIFQRFLSMKWCISKVQRNKLNNIYENIEWTFSPKIRYIGNRLSKIIEFSKVKNIKFDKRKE